MIFHLPKYQGLQNDFLIHDLRQGGRPFSVDEVRWLLDRRRGVGADGLLALHPSERAVARMVVHNADGTIAEMCGNGLRCAAKHLADASPGRPARLDIETGAGVLACLLTYGPEGRVSLVEVEMGEARLVAPNLPAGAPLVDAPLPGHPDLRGTAVSMGNPHLVLSAAALHEVTRLGPLLERHPAFPDGTNVEFVQPEGSGLRVNVWERGSGFTRACGTGACAAAAAWVHRGLLPAERWLPVDLPGGRLEIQVAGDLSLVRMKGPAEFSFEAVVAVPSGR
jgi:diaminopimelate epimerase